MKYDFDILIYGFGWTGKQALRICDEFGLSYKIVDDSLIKLNESFITINEIGDIQMVFICVNGNLRAQENIKNKLIKIGISDDKIKNVDLRLFRSTYLNILRKSFTRETLIKFLQDDDKGLSAFLGIIYDIGQEYKDNQVANKNIQLKFRKEIDARYPQLNIFSKIFATSIRESDCDLLHYPFFHVFTDRSSSDKNFFFRDNIDFHKLKNRDKNIKLILCFGSSVVRADEIPNEYTIAGYLSKLLKADSFKTNSLEYKVLNLGISGYTTPDMIALYISLFDALKPDIVVCLFFGNELITASTTDKILLKDFYLYYHPFLEKEAKKAFYSSIPLYSEFRDILSCDEYKNILQAISFRIEQFCNIVRISGAKFYPIITPFLHMKLHMTTEEIQGQKRAESIYPPSYFYHIDKQEFLLKEFKNMVNIDIYDANMVTKYSSDSLFFDWIHLNKNGCRIVGEYILNIIRNNK